MPGTSVSPEIRLLSAQLRTKDPQAIARVIGVLRTQACHIGNTAEALGISRRTLHLWLEEIPEFAAEFREHSTGPGEVVTLTYQKRTMRLGEWAKERGIKPRTLAWRLAQGHPVEKALTPGPLVATAKRPKKKARAKRKPGRTAK